MKYIILLLIVSFISACQKSDSVQELQNIEQNIATQKPCTKEAKVCPNGRSVSRNPQNNCEFDPCQKAQATVEEKQCTADVKQCPDGSFIGRNGFNNCQFGECPPTNNGRDGLQ